MNPYKLPQDNLLQNYTRFPTAFPTLPLSPITILEGKDCHKVHNLPLKNSSEK